MFFFLFFFGLINSTNNHLLKTGEHICDIRVCKKMIFLTEYCLYGFKWGRDVDVTIEIDSVGIWDWGEKYKLMYFENIEVGKWLKKVDGGYIKLTSCKVNVVPSGYVVNT